MSRVQHFLWYGDQCTKISLLCSSIILHFFIVLSLILLRLIWRNFSKKNIEFVQHEICVFHHGSILNKQNKVQRDEVGSVRYLTNSNSLYILSTFPFFVVVLIYNGVEPQYFCHFSTVQTSFKTDRLREYLKMTWWLDDNQTCQLLKIKCGWNANSASQPANYSKPPKWSPGVKTLKCFAIWPKYWTGRSYLGTKLLDELKSFSSVIYKY